MAETDSQPIAENEQVKELLALLKDNNLRTGFINLHEAFCCAAGLCSSAGPKTHCGWSNIHQKRKALFVHVQLFHQRFNHIGAVVWTPGSLGNHLQSGIFNLGRIST